MEGTDVENKTTKKTRSKLKTELKPADHDKEKTPDGAQQRLAAPSQAIEADC